MLTFVDEPKKAAVLERFLAQMSGSEQFAEIHSTLLRKDGALVDVLIHSATATFGGQQASIGVILDITEHNKALQRIREEEAKFRSLVEQDVAGIVIVRDDGTIGFCNGCFANMIGRTSAKILGLPLLNFVPETERPIIAESLRAQIFGIGAPVQIASTVIARDGSLVEVLVNASKSTFEGSAASIAVVVDVTSRNKAQRELASTAAILAAEHESSPDGILVVDPVGRVISVNRRFREMFGIPDELLACAREAALLALALHQVSDADALPSPRAISSRSSRESGHDELVLKDGRVIDRLTSPFKTADGENLGRIWFFRDITERRNAEASLRASEERFRTLVEEAPDAIMLYDLDQDRLVSANKAAERLFGVSRNEILEHGLRRFYAPEQPDGRPAAQSFEHNERALAGEEVTFERWIRRPSGEERICRATLVRLPSNVRLLRASLVDITEQRAAEAQLSEVLRSTVAVQEAERQRIARELHDFTQPVSGGDEHEAGDVRSERAEFVAAGPWGR